MFVSFQNIKVEGARQHLATVSAGWLDFYKCAFTNAGFDSVEAYDQGITFGSCCIFEVFRIVKIYSGCEGFLLVDSGNVIYCFGIYLTLW